MNFKLPEKKAELLKRVGNISQIAGTKRYVLSEGRGAGVECVDVRTGSGFAYTVMPGRGMDIGWCEYQGIPIAYISKVGISAPTYFTGNGNQWLQTFPGGLLSTCGLGNVGDDCEDEVTGLGTQKFGLHGRISNQCAKNICVRESWDADRFIMEVSGTDTESQLRGENFSLQRTVTGKLGESCLHVRDVITNEDFIERPFMLMYHINFGYPIVDEGAKVMIRGTERFEDTAVSIENADRAYDLTAPQNGIDENLYFHKTRGRAGMGLALIVNEALAMAAYVRYSAGTLPYLTEWKMMGESDYVVGLEAGNCIPRGRRYHRERGLLQMLNGQEQAVCELEIGVVCGREEIDRFLNREGFI